MKHKHKYKSKKKKKKLKQKMTKKKQQKYLKIAEYLNTNNQNNFYIPKNTRKETRIFVVFGHSSVCSFEDLHRIKINEERKGLRFNMQNINKKYPRLKYITAQSLGQKNLQNLAKIIIQMLKSNKKLYSAFLQIDSIQSAENFNKLFNYFLSKTRKMNHNFFKSVYNEKITDFNVYPKKKGPNPINSQYSFVFDNPYDTNLGIYEITEEPSYTLNELNVKNNRNNLWDLKIHTNEILYNRGIEDIFIKRKKKLKQQYDDMTKIKSNSLHFKKALLDLHFQKISHSLLIPDEITAPQLYYGPLSTLDKRNKFNEFTELNRALFELIKRKTIGQKYFDDVRISMEEIIKLIIKTKNIYPEEDVIILDFGCKGIRGIEGIRPTISGRESVVRVNKSILKRGAVNEDGHFSREWKRYYNNIRPWL